MQRGRLVVEKWHVQEWTRPCLGLKMRDDVAQVAELAFQCLEAL